MNPDNNAFEKLLKAQTIRQVPDEWRASILPPQTQKQEAWPNRYGWPALAVCWVIILGLHLVTQTPPTLRPTISRALSPAAREFQQTTYQLALAVLYPESESH